MKRGCYRSATEWVTSPINNKRSPDTGDLMLQIKLVAGACNQRYLQLWSGAA